MRMTWARSLWPWPLEDSRMQSCGTSFWSVWRRWRTPCRGPPSRRRHTGWPEAAGASRSSTRPSRAASRRGRGTSRPWTARARPGASAAAPPRSRSGCCCAAPSPSARWSSASAPSTPRPRRCCWTRSAARRRPPRARSCWRAPSSRRCTPGWASSPPGSSPPWPGASAPSGRPARRCCAPCSTARRRPWRARPRRGTGMPRACRRATSPCSARA
mmetsp:Transcript_19175/g.54151  ORF Transcript_19175/g.54151 Transcript_19175/m.54151 type:complete len:215 (-) Transcript_19175:477-1121(-)